MADPGGATGGGGGGGGGGGYGGATATHPQFMTTLSCPLL